MMIELMQEQRQKVGTNYYVWLWSGLEFDQEIAKPLPSYDTTYEATIDSCRTSWLSTAIDNLILLPRSKSLLIENGDTILAHGEEYSMAHVQPSVLFPHHGHLLLLTDRWLFGHWVSNLYGQIGSFAPYSKEIKLNRPWGWTDGARQVQITSQFVL